MRKATGKAWRPDLLARTTPTSTLAALVLLLATGSLFAQDGTGTFFDTLDVRVVNLEVVVTDGQGRRVPGLSAEDFRLLVDGQEVEIDYFSEVRDGRAFEAHPAPAASAGPRPAVGDGAVPTHYLVFIDDYFSLGAHRNLVLSGLSNQLDRLGPADAMAVVAFDGQGLEVLTGWSAPGPPLAHALEEASRRRAFGIFHLAETRGLGGDSVQRLAQASRHTLQVETAVSAAITAMRALPRPQGRKVLMLLAGGWPYSPGEDTDLFSTVGDPGERDGARPYQPLADTANLLGYTIYPVDVPGLGASGPDVTATRPNGAALLRPSHESGLEASLLYLARETGGRAMLNSLRDDALDAAASDTRSYYWLGFTSHRRADDQRHEVRVEPVRPGRKVRTRKGFVDISAETDVAMLLEGSLLLGGALSPTHLPVRVVDVQRKPQRKMEISLVVEIPVDEITVIEAGGEHVSQVAVQIGAIDARGTLSESINLPVRLTTEREPKPGDLIHYDVTLTMWRKEHQLVVALRDVVTGNLLVNRLRVEP